MSENYDIEDILRKVYDRVIDVDKAKELLSKKKLYNIDMTIKFDSEESRRHFLTRLNDLLGVPMLEGGLVSVSINIWDYMIEEGEKEGGLEDGYKKVAVCN